MKYCILIIDGASGLPLPERGGETCLELAYTPNLDAMVREGILGLVRTVPPGMEPSSACACMSVLGYDPKLHYRGRAAIEARSMGITIDEGEAVFRCNLMAIRDGRMWDYSAGHISTNEAQQLIGALNESLGSDKVHFYPGVSYRHLCKLKGREDTLLATCTPPHDIHDKVISEFLPKGPGSELLRDLMERSRAVLWEHPVNVEPAFKQIYGLNAAITSAVDVVRGLARMMGMGVLDIPGVKDGLDNDYVAQAVGALTALKEYDLVVIHIEATDEAAHAGSIDDKIEAIQRVDREVLSRIRSWRPDNLRTLIMPDHPTPIKTQTHSGEPVPFMLWGPGFIPNGAKRFTEAEAKSTGFFIEEGYKIMGRLIGLII